MAGRIIPTNGVELWCETLGNPADPAILLMMGNSAPALMWPDAFCDMLVRGGRYVIRFDQRDTGLSSYMDFERNPYDLLDLLADAVGLLGALGMERAHIVGLSQGGMLAYRMAALHPDHVLSLTALHASHDLAPKADAFAGLAPRDGALPQPDPAFIAGVIAINAQPAANEDDAVTQLVENFRLAKGPRSPFDEGFWRALMGRMVELPRLRPDGLTAKVANHGNHARAQAASPTIPHHELASIAAPTLIIHGADDPIFPPAHAEAAAGTIAGARLLMIADMGHALDPAFFEPVAEAILAHTGTAEKQSA